MEKDEFKSRLMFEIEKNDNEVLITENIKDDSKEPLEEVKDTLLEQLKRLKKLKMNDPETELEIKRSNAISNTSKTILQTIGIQMMVEKQKRNCLLIEEENA